MSIQKPQRFRLVPADPGFAGQTATIVCPPPPTIAPPPPGVGQVPPGDISDYLFSTGITPEEFNRRVGLIRDSAPSKPSGWVDATDTLNYASRIVAVGAALFRTFEWWHARTGPGSFARFVVQSKILYGATTNFTLVRQTGWARQRNSRCIETLTLHSVWNYPGGGTTLQLAGGWEIGATLYQLDTDRAPFNPAATWARSDRI